MSVCVYLPKIVVFLFYQAICVLQDVRCMLDYAFFGVFSTPTGRALFFQLSLQ